MAHPLPAEQIRFEWDRETKRTIYLSSLGLQLDLWRFGFSCSLKRANQVKDYSNVSSEEFIPNIQQRIMWLCLWKTRKLVKINQDKQWYETGRRVNQIPSVHSLFCLRSGHRANPLTNNTFHLIGGPKVFPCKPVVSSQLDESKKISKLRLVRCHNNLSWLLPTRRRITLALIPQGWWIDPSNL